MIKRLVVLAALGLVGLLILPVAVIATANAQASVAGPPSAEALDDVPPRLLVLYQQAVVDRCPTLPWSVVAGIGKVESNHGRLGGAELQDDGTVSPPIIGVALDGSGDTQEIRDTDGGLYDNDGVYDRAVGPMQFIPQTWVSVGMDADRNGVADPHDIDDAIPSAAAYLCGAGGGDPARLRQAIWTYNHSWQYVDEVLAWATRYATLTPAGPADPVLIAAVLGNSRLEIYEAGRQDIEAGRIDNRVLAILLRATEQWTLSVSSLQTGHSKCVGGGSYEGCSISNHWYGRAFDVYRVNGELVSAGNTGAYALTVWLSSLEPDLRPDEIGSPWPDLEGIPGNFHDAAHLDHIHAGHD